MGFVSEATWKIVFAGAGTPFFSSPKTFVYLSFPFSMMPTPTAGTLVSFIQSGTFFSNSKLIDVGFVVCTCTGLKVEASASSTTHHRVVRLINKQRMRVKWCLDQIGFKKA